MGFRREHVYRVGATYLVVLPCSAWMADTLARSEGPPMPMGKASPERPLGDSRHLQHLYHAPDLNGEPGRQDLRHLPGI
jgi:hypothetical protein